MKHFDQTSSVGPTMRTGEPKISMWRAFSNHSSPTGMVPFEEAKMTSKKCWPL
jgi:hypothetical protein